MKVEQNLFFDLNIDEVAMITHTFLKKLQNKYQTISIHIEKMEYDVADEKDPERIISIERYTLFIIVSQQSLSNKELMKIYKEIQGEAIKKRGMT